MRGTPLQQFELTRFLPVTIADGHTTTEQVFRDVKKIRTRLQRLLSNAM